MEKKFKYLEHTADIGIETYGVSLIEAFQNAGLGLYNLMADVYIDIPDINKYFILSGIDLEALLVNFLSEILFLFEVEGFIGINISIIKIEKNENGYEMSVKIEGIKFKREKHTFKTGVKAVTYHQLKITSDNESTIIQVFFDI